MLLREIVEARDVLNKLVTKNCKPKLAYTVMKLLKETEDSADFYIKKYREIMDECAEKNEDGSFKQDNGLFIIKDGCEDLFNEKINDLRALEVDSINRKIKLSDMDDSLRLTPIEMSNLEIFITEE